MPIMLVGALASAQAILAALLIVVGGTVEGYGYGLSLGTKWPYTRGMARLAKAGDPEVWHRIIATLLGLNSLVILVLKPALPEITGFVLIALTALLGMATLYVLAGKAPSLFQGLHDLLAYLTLLTYLLIATDSQTNLGVYLLTKTPLHSFLLVLFLGGVVTGQRGFKKPIGHFVIPNTLAQWIWVVHGLSALLFTLTLAYFVRIYTVAFILLMVQIGVGVLVYQAVNKSAEKPGILVPVHQLLTVLILVSMFFNLSVPLPFLG